MPEEEEEAPNMAEKESLFSKLSPRFRLRSLRTGSGTIGAGCVSIS